MLKHRSRTRTMSRKDEAPEEAPAENKGDAEVPVEGKGEVEAPVESKEEAAAPAAHKRPKLPFDVLCLVAEHLAGDIGSLRACTRASPELALACRFVLYRQVPIPSYEHLQMWMRTILKTPGFQHKIRELWFHPFRRADQVLSPDLERLEVYIGLRMFTKHLVNLNTLHIGAINQSRMPAVRDSLLGTFAYCTSLTTLVLTAAYVPAITFRAILGSLPMLSELRMDCVFLTKNPKDLSQKILNAGMTHPLRLQALFQGLCHNYNEDDPGFLDWLRTTDTVDTLRKLFLYKCAPRNMLEVTRFIQAVGDNLEELNFHLEEPMPRWKQHDELQHLREFSLEHNPNIRYINLHDSRNPILRDIVDQHPQPDNLRKVELTMVFNRLDAVKNQDFKALDTLLSNQARFTNLEEFQVNYQGMMEFKKAEAKVQRIFKGLKTRGVLRVVPGKPFPRGFVGKTML
ncbi:hypothetical protein K474DRAFT_1531974 [Panus rudis PR-1116 ss-1]|nr:hypothetical protein K474DRAFT_1531974 [Panus rudis PR-1116 ss-1]